MNTPVSRAPSGPLHIDRLGLERLSTSGAVTGLIGMTHCPGRSGPDGAGRAWQRNVERDVAAIRAAGFDTVLTLVDDAELARLGASGLPARLQQAGIDGLRFPIADFGVPDGRALQAWAGIQAELLARLQRGRSVLVHCAAGLGRTGTMVATLLTALGDSADTAIARVRAARPGTIETEAQARFVHDQAASRPTTSATAETPGG